MGDRGQTWEIARRHGSAGRHGNQAPDMEAPALTWERGRLAGELCPYKYKAS